MTAGRSAPSPKGRELHDDPHLIVQRRSSVPNYRHASSDAKQNTSSHSRWRTPLDSIG